MRAGVFSSLGPSVTALPTQLRTTERPSARRALVGRKLPNPMFERFTERARQVVVLAQEEARTLKHNYIGTEHILLGLLREEEGLAARVLESLDITVERVRAQVVRIVGSGEEVTSGQIPFTPRAKKVLELALREALSLGHNYIGTEHILLGLVRENEGVAARILLDFDADSEKIRNEVIRMLSGPGGRRARAAPARARRPPAARRARARRSPPSCSTSSGATSPSWRPTASWIPSSGARPRSSGSCRSSRGAPRTTPCSSASRASARPRWSRAWPSASPTATCRSCSRTSRSTRSTWRRWSRARSTAASSRSA